MRASDGVRGELVTHLVLVPGSMERGEANLIVTPSLLNTASPPICHWMLPDQRKASSNGAHRARSSAPARSGSATKIVLTPSSASSR